MINNISSITIYGITKTISIVVGIIMLILLVLYLVLSLKKIKAGPIIGIVTGSLYITNLSLINIALGICFIVSCADMLKTLKKES